MDAGDNRGMSELCKNCGEELIGAVNRCWQCGTPVPVTHHPTEPPIRRSPVHISGVSPSPVVAPTTTPTIQFSDRTRFLCALASVWVGTVACLIGLASLWSVLPAVVGISLGVIGMTSRRRDLASTGLVIAVLAMFLGFAQFGYDIWTKHQSQQLLNGYQQQPF